MSINIKTLLTKRLTQPLPGYEAQKTMSPLKTKRYLDIKNAKKYAAVLALLYPDDKGELNMIFIKRPSNNPHDKHGGQISFPGGQKEEADKNYKETALRECYEEIGVQKDAVEILGALTPIYVYVSDFYVQPFIGYTPQKPEFVLQETEVDYILTEKISYLNTDESIHKTDFKVRDIVMRNMPYYKLGEEILWGATAMITAEIMQIFRELE